MRKIIIISIVITMMLSCSSICIACNSYFVHVTDTHILHQLYDPSETRIDKLQNLIDNINSFPQKPSFIAITGDLVEWGNGMSGSLNYMALINCFHKNDSQYYIDSNFSIPVYFTPGNHDYYQYWNLINYHRFINKDKRYVVTFDNTSLFFIDSGFHCLMPIKFLRVLGSGITRHNIRWLDNSLKNCESKHKIILMHHPAINWFNSDVIARNRYLFIDLCEKYDVDLVLTGHTHASRVFDNEGNFYPNNILPLNCSQYSTLHVQTDACKEGSYYRNVSIIHNDMWINQCICIE